MSAMLLSGFFVAVLFAMQLQSGLGCSKLNSSSSYSSRLDYWNKNYCLHIQCPKDNVLVQLSVTSGNLRNDTDGCFGLSPQLMADTANCYWKTNCSVRFPLDQLLISTDVTEIITCAGDRPKFLQVSNARCAKRKEIIDMQIYKKKKSKKKGHKVKKQVKSIRLNKVPQGIITSHTMYPWNYSNDLFRDEVVEYVTTFRWPKKFSKTKKLLVGVHVRSICDTEQLELVSRDTVGPLSRDTVGPLSRDTVGPLNETHNTCTWEYQKEKKKKKPKETKGKNDSLPEPKVSEANCNSIQYFKKRSKLEIRFKRGVQSQTKTCEGFLLCFKVVKKSMTISGHVCDLVADKIPCITERGAFTEQCERTKDLEDCCCPGVPEGDCTETYSDMEDRWQEIERT